MNDFLRWLLKFLAHGVFWVFVLSIRWDGRSMFYFANEVLVQNALVEAIDEQLGELWYKVSRTAKTTFNESEPEDPKSM